MKEARDQRIWDVWFHLREILEKGKLISTERKHIRGCLRLGVWGALTAKGHVGIFKVMEKILILILVVAT